MAKYLLSGKKYWNKAVAILSVTICFAVTGCAGRIDDADMPGLIQEEDIISNNNASVVYENETEKDTKSGVKVEIPAQTESATAVVEKSDVAKSASGVTGKRILRKKLHKRKNPVRWLHRKILPQKYQSLLLKRIQQKNQLWKLKLNQLKILKRILFRRLKYRKIQKSRIIRVIQIMETFNYQCYNM